MTEHLPECLHDDRTYGLRGLCICDELRACEQRVGRGQAVDSSTGMADDSPANRITATIHEYGNILMTAPLHDGTIPSNVLEAATVMLGNQTQEIREVLDICGDAEIIENFHIVEGPNVDIFNRFKPLGFYGRFASANYDKLAAHFFCRKEHVPDDLTMEFLTQMIGRYALQEKMRSYNEDDGDRY